MPVNKKSQVRMKEHPFLECPKIQKKQYWKNWQHLDAGILIWVQRGNKKAAKLIEKDKGKFLLIQG